MNGTIHKTNIKSIIQGGYIMKIGVISDIHGNINEMEAVLKELKNKNIDKIICLGDVIRRGA